MKTFLYVGLGNVGDRYLSTRHNLGITTLRAWVATLAGRPEYQSSDWREYSEYLVCSLLVTGSSLRTDCLFPTTMMNNSGQAVAAYLKKVPTPTENIVVIHDDVELPLGEVQETVGGSAKGHNGVRSIQQALGTSDFGRLRLGVGRPPDGVALADFVLQKFLPAEQSAVEEMISKGVSELTARRSLE